MAEKVLIVDDDLEILNSFRRYFYKTLNLETASNPIDALKMVKDFQFQVIVSDYKMPQMDGIRFLTLTREISPDSSRIMLTGYADVQTAIDAVNQGQIFRFLTKPSPPESVEVAIQAGIEYYKLKTAERVLLEQTLNGSISLLVEILSLVNPVAFSRTSRIKKIVTGVVKSLNLTPAWIFELAATLSQIGFVAIPPELLEKVFQQKSLSEQERIMINNHPVTARKLIEKIPRMEIVAQMIANQQKVYTDYPYLPAGQLPKDIGDMGAQILKVAIDYDNFSAAGYSYSEILRSMELRKGYYNPMILSALGATTTSSMQADLRKVNVYELEIGMIVDEDITTLDQKLLLQRGQEITETVLIRLRNINTHSKIKEPFTVLVPRRG
ncbi:MAG TPA: HD domain-containing phosphohydrolase [Anaerolineaceae bacterium]